MIYRLFKLLAALSLVVMIGAGIVICSLKFSRESAGALQPQIDAARQQSNGCSQRRQEYSTSHHGSWTPEEWAYQTKLTNEATAASQEWSRLLRLQTSRLHVQMQYLWLMQGAMVLPIAWAQYRAWLKRRKERRLIRGLCPACGYDLRASKDRCPECGAAFARNPAWNSRALGG